MSESGCTLVPALTTLPPSTEAEFGFRITDPGGNAVREYETVHEKRLHLIVVRHDLAIYRHLHPELQPDGTWSLPLALPEPGPYRAFADFAPSGRSGLVLGTDLTVVGDYRPVPLPPAVPTAEVDGYTVTITSTPDAGLAFSVERDGRAVGDLQPYLGAYAHLVGIRAGDLTYLHAHPVGGRELRFHVMFPGSGAYRLFLDFRHGDAVHTAAFTVEAGA